MPSRVLANNEFCKDIFKCDVFLVIGTGNGYKPSYFKSNDYIFIHLTNFLYNFGLILYNIWFTQNVHSYKK